MRRFLTIVALLLVCLVLTSGCKSKTETQPGAPTTGSATTPSGNNAKDDLTKAMKAVVDAKSYRSTLTSSNAGAVQSVTTIEFAAPDRFRMLQDLNTGDRGTIKKEMIVVGGDVYMRPAAGEWQKMPVDMSKMLASLRDPKVIDAIAKEADVKFLGTEQFNGQSMNVYEYTMKNALGSGVNAVTKTWIGQADYRPYKIETDQEVNLNGKTEKNHTSTTYTDYDADIKIDAPPVKGTK